MKSFDELKKDFDKRVRVMQSRCRHEKSAWMEEWWALAHSTGYKVKVCEFCKKVLRRAKDRKNSRWAD